MCRSCGRYTRNFQVALEEKIWSVSKSAGTIVSLGYFEKSGGTNALFYFVFLCRVRILLWIHSMWGGYD